MVIAGDGGLGNFPSYGDWPDANGDLWPPQGVILNQDLSAVYPLDQREIAEYITHSWYEYDDENKSRHPWDGN